MKEKQSFVFVLNEAKDNAFEVRLVRHSYKQESQIQRAPQKEYLTIFKIDKKNLKDLQKSILIGNEDGSYTLDANNWLEIL